MKQILFRGAATALVTPMHPDGSLDLETLSRLTEWQIQSSISALVPCGTTGEAATLTDEERFTIIQTVAKTAAGRVPVIAGAGCNDTARAEQNCLAAAAAGVDALLLVTPYYNKTSQTGLIRHFHAIADATDLPIILYNVPSRTGVNITPETYRALSAHPNIVATKEASGNISHIAQVIQTCGDQLDVYSGNDDQIVPLLALGAKGVISVLSNVMPRQTHDICQLFFDGKIEQSRQLQLELLELINALFSDVNPIPVKQAMNLMGYRCGSCRLPLDEMQPQARQHLEELLRRHKLV